MPCEIAEVETRWWAHKVGEAGKKGGVVGDRGGESREREQILQQVWDRHGRRCMGDKIAKAALNESSRKAHFKHARAESRRSGCRAVLGLGLAQAALDKAGQGGHAADGRKPLSHGHARRVIVAGHK